MKSKGGIEVPHDLAAALAAKPRMLEMWQRLRPSCQREHVESVLEAKRPDTRGRRVAAVLKATAEWNRRHPGAGTRRRGEKPVRMLCIYRVKKGKEAVFRKLIARHWPTLHRLGLATSTPAQVLRGVGKRGGPPCFIELFEWAGASASDMAHQTPEVLAIWEPMEPLLESMELIQLESPASS